MDTSFYLVVIFAMLMLAFASAYNFKTKEFSGSVFLVSVAIGIAILVWIPLVAAYYIVFPVLIIGGLLFMPKETVKT